jgi:hypothetical protein
VLSQYALLHPANNFFRIAINPHFHLRSQYVVKRQYENFVIQSYETNGNLEIFAVSDLPKDTTAAVTVSMLYINGNVCPVAGKKSGVNTGPVAWAATSKEVAVPANNAALVLNVSIADMLKLAPDCTPSTCYVRVEAEADAVGLSAKTAPGGKLQSSSDSFLVEFKNLDLQKPNISVANFKQVRRLLILLHGHVDMLKGCCFCTTCLMLCTCWKRASKGRHQLIFLLAYWDSSLLGDFSTNFLSLELCRPP